VHNCTSTDAGPFSKCHQYVEHGFQFQNIPRNGERDVANSWK
jgi:hypothetical protein